MHSQFQTGDPDLNEVLLDTDPSTMALALELTDVGVFDYDPVIGRLRFSKRCKLLWGIALDEEPTLARLDQLLHPDDEALIEHFMASLDPTGLGSFDVDQRIVRPDGSVVWVRSRGRTVFGSEEEGRRAVRCVGTMRDVTEQHRVRDELVQSAARKAYLLRLSDALRPLTSPVEIQVIAAKVLCERLKASRVMYCEVEEGDDEAFVVHRDYRREHVPSAVGHHRFHDYGDHIVPALHEGRTLVVRDVHEIPECTVEAVRAYEALGMRAYVLAPLVKGEKICSFLAVDQTTPRDWSEQEIALVQETAERTWAAVGHARAEAALRASDRRKDEFLATLAHELRNPLAPLRNGLQITRMKCPADPTLTRAVEMMDRQLSHLVRLVDDLLDVGRINTGKLELRRQPLRLSEVLASSIEAVRALLDSRRHELLVELGEDGRTVFGDFDRLAQVFINLLTNAAKYTEPGGRIRVSLMQVGNQEVVRVEDTGIGIASEDLPKVFELFSQVRTENRNGGSGLGIGLSLVRRLVELHGGTVQAESAGIGLGSVFTVRLPVTERVGRSAQQPQEEDADAVGTTHRRVLVIDDNVEAADSLASVLQLMGHETAVAYDGFEGLELAQEMKPDLVLLDLGMPMMDGLETARRMRALESLEGVHIVAVTGWGLESDRARTRAAGFDAHLVKPVDVSTLEEILADFRPRAA